LGRVRLALAVVAAALCAGAGLPAGASGAPTSITEFPVDFGHQSNLEGLVVAPDGNIWFGNYWWPEGSYHALIGRMDGAGNVDEFDQGLNKYSSISELIAGPGGYVWFADDGSAIGGAAVGRIASDGTITRFTAGLGGSRPRTIVVGPDGNLWFTGLGSSPAIGFATPEGAIKAFSLPGRPWDAVGGPDGNIWFTYGGEGVAPAIGRLVLKEDGGAVVTLFHSGLAAESLPGEIVSSQDGHLWFNDRSDTTPAIGRVSMSGEIEEFSAGLNPKGGIWDIAAGPTGDIWFTDRGGDDVGRVSPQGQITELGNGELIEPRYITPGPDGNMWFTYWGGIGKISPSGVVTRLKDGLSPSASPQEIVSGPGGRLWFIANDWTAPAIGRIIPGDDEPSPALARPYEPPSPPFAIGRIALQGASIPLSRGGRGILRLACRSSAPCSGSIRLVVFRRGWKAGRLIWASSFSIDAWGSAGVRVKLKHAGKKLLAQGGEVRARLQVNPSSAVLPLSQRVKLRLVAQTPGR
jgi:virginiamycin B lyase